MKKIFTRITVLFTVAAMIFSALPFTVAAVAEPALIITAGQLADNSNILTKYRMSFELLSDDSLNYIRYTSSGNDPYYEFKTPYRTNSSNKYAVVKYRTASQEIVTIDLYPRIAEPHALFSALEKDGQWHYAYADLSDAGSNWTGAINRFDPMNADEHGSLPSGQVMDIAWIAFFSTAEEAHAYADEDAGSGEQPQIAVTYGDCNRDSTINGKDIIRLRKYLSSYDDQTGEADVEYAPGMDCNGDGNVNGRDLIRLRKYLATYDEATETADVILGPAIVCTEHVWGEWTVTKQPTCIETGKEQRKCTVCHTAEEREIGTVDHTFGEWVTTTAPTCMNEGLKVRTCPVCGETEEETLPKVSHCYGDDDKCVYCGRERTPVTPDEYFVFTLLDDGTYSIAAADTDNLPEEIIIPGTHEGIPVTVIAEEAFLESGIRKVYISDNVKKIGASAFEACFDLTAIELPAVLEEIGEFAFIDCGITEIDIPVNVTVIGKKAFTGCNITELSVGKWIENASQNNNLLSQGFESLTAVTVAEGVTRIGYYAFYNYAGLTSVTIGDGVTSIGESAFAGCTGLTSVTIPDGVTMIGNYAFSGCSGLTSVTIGNGVTSIGKYAFAGCSGLTSITIPNSVKSIGDYAFFGCSSLTKMAIGKWIETGLLSDIQISRLIEVVILDGVTSIGNYAFYNCSSLKRITIPDSVTSIGKYAFAGCSGLTSITIPNNVTSIRSAAFEGCSSLSIVNIKSLSSWCHIAFVGTSSNPVYFSNNLYLNGSLIEDLVVPDDITEIGEFTFYNCSSLKSVTIPDSVTSIGNSAFYNCSGLMNVTIGDGVTSIGSAAFEGCGALSNVYIKSLSSWCHIAFDDLFSNPVSFSKKLYLNGSLIEDIVVPDDITEIGEFTFYNCSSLKSVTIPDSVTSIGNSAFYNCSGLTSITIPDSVTRIGFAAFTYCRNIECITLPFIGGGSGCEYTHFGYIFGALDHTGHEFYVPASLKTVILKEGCEVIPAYAFYHCANLTNVTIPDTVTVIGKYAFADCYRLTDINIPDGLVSLGVSAFTGLPTIEYENGIYCGNEQNPYMILTGIIDNTVTRFTINENTRFLWCTFSGCSNLRRIKLPDSITEIPEEEFNNCSALTSVTIPDSVTSIGSYAFSGCSSLTSVTIPDSVTNIGGSAFLGCSSLESMTLPFIGGSKSTNTFLSYIFGASYYNATGYIPKTLKTVIISDKCDNLHAYAFYNCSGLTSITIPDSVTRIGGSAFSGCSSLTSIFIPDGVTSIGSSAFRDCISLTSISIPDSVTSIGSFAFYGCSSLTSIIIPDSVTSIGDFAFFGCSALTTVYYTGSQSDWKKISIGINNDPLKNATKVYNYQP